MNIIVQLIRSLDEIDIFWISLYNLIPWSVTEIVHVRVETSVSVKYEVADRIASLNLVSVAVIHLYVLRIEVFHEFSRSIQIPTHVGP